ncbi:outer membrane protein transport protein [Vibrio sp. THAF190c]|uniref:outer membrane protein transport protein n=1 Tax=Vibrio sp. THAF190c TaxID=2587865 RepID=UPI001268C448|nr:outer membrane protein transport protein [Vibrio sp. THAF190c]QFT13019.1 Long-chain fatty acid transport protein precursor [Vibrio sp. THAF190c]
MHKVSFKRTLLSTSLLMLSSNAIGSGFQLNSQSATGLGRAFSGDAVIADNASSMARNPASMALFDDVSLSLGLIAIKSMIEVKDTQYQGFNGVDHTSYSSNFDDAGATSFVPNFHLIVPMDEQWAFGTNLYTNFGTRTDFGDSFTGSEYGGETEIVSTNLGLSLSYRFDSQWSVGGGIDLIYGQGTLKRNLSQKLPSGFAGTTALDIDEASGWAVGYNLGGVYELNRFNRFGLSYRYSPSLTVEDGEKEVTLSLPDMAEFSGYHDIEHSRFAFHYSIQFFRWSEFDKISFKNARVPENRYDWKDTYHISVGTTYSLNRKWDLRMGYMYDESAQDATRSIAIPDSDRQWFSAGATYRLDPSSNVDIGFAYVLGKDVTVEQTIPTEANSPLRGADLSSLNGTTRADGLLLGVQYSQSF